MERDLDKLQDAENRAKSSSKNKRAKVWVVGSGKGGVGKTFVSSSLAISLTKLGHQVVIVDLDLSGANVHTSLGITPSHMNVRHFFEGKKSLQELVIPTSFAKLSYVQGFWDSWVPTDFTQEQIQRLIPELRSLRADYVIVDLGAGAMAGHLDLFRAADEKILVTSPEPSSIEKTYRYIEAYVCDTIREDATPAAWDELLVTLRQHRQGSLNRPFSFKTYLMSQTGIQFNFFESLNQNPVRLIINGARNHENTELGHSIRSVCFKYYDLSIDYAGAIDFDNAVWQAARVREPMLIAQPFTPLAGQFLSICKHLIDPEELRAVV